MAFGRRRIWITGKTYVEVDPRLFPRPAEVDLLVGDASKAARVLGWQPRYTFAQVIDEMVKADMAIATDRSRLG